MRMRWRKIVTDLTLLIAGFLIGRELVHRRNEKLLFSHSGPCKEHSQREIAERKPSIQASDTFMIGVMTSKRYLATRATAIYATWGAESSGFVVFYVGKDDSSQEDPQLTVSTLQYAQPDFKKFDSEATEEIKPLKQLPVVELEGVDDEEYPPRDKCFAMLRHMFHNYGRQFRWFIRADDDVYIRTEELAKYLHSLDSTRLLYIGQPGMGIVEERGLLGLETGRPYCMGGPGVVFSALCLRLLVPHLPECAEKVVTSHEDTELGRCVTRHLNISCSSNRTMRSLFQQSYRKDGYNQSLSAGMLTALTLHPVKDPRTMLKLHLELKIHKLKTVQNRHRQLLSEVKLINKLAEGSRHNVTMEKYELDTSLTFFNRRQEAEDFVEKKLNPVQNTPAKSSQKRHDWFTWQNAIAGVRDLRFLLTGQNSVGRKENDTASKATTILEVLRQDNPVWSLAIFKTSSFSIDSTRWGISAKCMKKAINDFISLQDSYGVNVPRERKIPAKYQTVTLTHGLQYFISVSHEHGYRSFLLSSKFQDLEWREIDHRHCHGNVLQDVSGEGVKTNLVQNVIPVPVSPAVQLGDNVVTTTPWPSLWVLLPLMGRHETYLRFLSHLSFAARNYPDKVHLRVALYDDPQGSHTLSLSASQGSQELDITVIQLHGEFSRAIALMTLAEAVNGTSILIFIDVDLIVTEQFLRRCALNVQPGIAYFPIMFSRYSPATVCYDRPNCSRELFDFSEEQGFWRSFGYGNVAITAQDMKAAGGFDTAIIGWGKEDVDFFERCLKNKIQVFRAPDVGLVHEYHDKSCDPKLPADQLSMCNGSKLAMYGSISKLAKIVGELEHLLF